MQQIPWHPAMESTIRLGGTLHAHLMYFQGKCIKMLRFLLRGPSLTTTNLIEIQLFWIYSHAGKEGMIHIQCFSKSAMYQVVESGGI